MAWSLIHIAINTTCCFCFFPRSPYVHYARQFMSHSFGFKLTLKMCLESYHVKFDRTTVYSTKKSSLTIDKQWQAMESEVFSMEYTVTNIGTCKCLGYCRPLPGSLERPTPQWHHQVHTKEQKRSKP